MVAPLSAFPSFSASSRPHPSYSKLRHGISNLKSWPWHRYSLPRHRCRRFDAATDGPLLIRGTLPEQRPSWVARQSTPELKRIAWEAMRRSGSRARDVVGRLCE